MTAGLAYFLILSAGLFAVGGFGLLARRDLVVILLSGELMMNAAGIAFVAFARLGAGRNHPLAGPAISAAILVVGLAELGLAMAIVSFLFRQRRTTQADGVDPLAD